MPDNTVVTQGVFPVAPESQRAYRVISDEEAAAAGLPSELTDADKLREENARLRAQLAGGPMVLDQGIRSTAPVFTETPREPPPKLVPWDQLPPRTRAEMEAGRAVLGGGLSAREAYERSTHVVAPPVPMRTDLSLPEIVVTAQPTARTLQEMANGRVLHRALWDDRQATMAAIAVQNAAKLMSGARPTGDEMSYVPDQPEV